MKKIIEEYNGFLIGSFIILALILALVVYANGLVVYTDYAKHKDTKSEHEELIQNVIYPNEFVEIEEYKLNTTNNTYEYNVRSKKNDERITIENEKSFDEYKYEKEIIK